MKKFYIFISLFLIFFLGVSVFNFVSSSKLDIKDEGTINNTFKLKFEKNSSKMLLHFEYIGTAKKVSINSLGSPFQIKRFKIFLSDKIIYVPFNFTDQPLHLDISKKRDLVFNIYRDSSSSNSWGEYNNIEISYLKFMPSVLYFTSDAEFTLKEEFSDGHVLITNYTTDIFKKDNENYFYFEPLLVDK